MLGTEGSGDGVIAPTGSGESPKWLAPRPTPEDREFWEGAHRGELRIQHCTTCGKHQHYARLLCSHCGEQTLEWITASGNATIYSFTVVRQNGVPPFNERVPFVVAVVDLDEDGARMIGAMPRARPRRMPGSACVCAPSSGRPPTSSASSTSPPRRRR